MPGNFFFSIPVFSEVYRYLTFLFRPSYQHCFLRLWSCASCAVAFCNCAGLSLDTVKESNGFKVSTSNVNGRALERWSARYICEPGLYLTSRLNCCRPSNILCNLHGAASTDFLKIAWSGLWPDPIEIFSRRERYWVNLWHATRLRGIPFLFERTFFLLMGVSDAVLKKGCSSSLFTRITL